MELCEAPEINTGDFLRDSFQENLTENEWSVLSYYM